LAEKKEWKTSEENKVLKMKEELMKVKSGNTQGKDATKLENEKMKENLKSLKILHKEQLRLNTSRISDQNSTIKSLQRKITALEKSEAKTSARFAEFQRQSVSNIAKLEHKKELIEIKEKKKKENENTKRKERINEKEHQKRKLEQAIMMHQGYMHHDNKMVQDKIINNFRSNSSSNHNNDTHLPYASMRRTQPRNPYYWSQAVKNVPTFDPQLSEINDMDNAIDLTQGHDASNFVRMIPKFASLLNNITGTVDHSTSDESSRGKEKK